MENHRLLTLDAFLEAYERHQKQVRGLRPRTIQGYQFVTRQFIRATLGEDPIDLTHLTPADIVSFIESISKQFRPSTMKTIGTSLRSFFRYLRVEGHCVSLSQFNSSPPQKCWVLDSNADKPDIHDRWSAVI